jgi:hypothetical protein
MPIRGWLACGLAALGCATAAKPAPSGAPSPGAKPHVMGTICGDFPLGHEDDRCSLLSDPLEEDRDGCPDWALTFGRGSTTMTPDPHVDEEWTLARLATELRNLGHLTKLQLRSSGARGESRALLQERVDKVVALLAQRGISRSLFVSKLVPSENESITDGFVAFEPLECDDGPIDPKAPPSRGGR